MTSPNALSASARPSAGPAIGPSFSLVPFDPTNAPDVDRLHASVFGPGRFARTAFRLREQAEPIASFCFTAMDRDNLIGAVTVSRIRVGADRGVLLGPLAVVPSQRERGVGRALLAKAVERAFLSGEPFVLLVGDKPYYEPFGFTPCAADQIVMPGPVAPDRLLVARGPLCADDMPKGVARGERQTRLPRRT
ncbi:MAG: N-acetyltransferase [Pseudomonadota bacterium]